MEVKAQDQIVLDVIVKKWLKMGRENRGKELFNGISVKSVVSGSVDQ